MGSEGLLAAILAATGGYRWLLVTMDGWTCYKEYMWLLAAILAATGGYMWLLASHMDGWGLRGYWRLHWRLLAAIVGHHLAEPVFTAEYMASPLLHTLLLLVGCWWRLLLPFSLLSSFSCCCWNSLLNSVESGNLRLLYLLCERSHDQWDDTENELEG